MMPDDFFKKNLDMWEKFTTSYMDNMFKVVEKTMEQSQAFKDRMDKAVADAVSNQVEGTMDATMSSMQALQRQIEALSAKVDQLMKQKETK